MRKWKPIVLAIFLAACRRNVPFQTGLTADELLSRDGMSAFQLATADGYEKAAAAFRRASVLQPSRCDYRLHLSESLLFLAKEEQSNWQDYGKPLSEASSIVKSADGVNECKAFSAYVSRLKALAALPQFGGSGEAARQLIQQAIAVDPADPMNFLVANELDRKSGDAVLRAGKLAPRWAAVQYALGNYWIDQGDLAQAKAAFRAALELSPAHYLSMLGLAYCISLDDSENPQPIYLGVIQAKPDFLAGRLFLARYYDGIDDTQRATEQYQFAVAQRSDYYPALLGLAGDLLRLNHVSEAREAAGKVIALGLTDQRQGAVQPFDSPTTCGAPCADSQAHYIVAMTQLSEGNLSLAETEFQESLKRAQNFDAAFNFGLMLRRQARRAEALTQFQIALRFEKYLTDTPGESQLADVLMARAGLFRETGQTALSIADYDRAIAVYQKCVDDLTKRAARSESVGLAQKAALERQEKTEIELRLKEARAEKPVDR